MILSQFLDATLFLDSDRTREILRKVRQIEIGLGVSLPMLLQGLITVPSRAGNGFDEVREYATGDDIRSID